MLQRILQSQRSADVRHGLSGCLVDHDRASSGQHQALGPERFGEELVLVQLGFRPATSKLVMKSLGFVPAGNDSMILR